MKKFIGFLTAFIMTVCAMSCGITVTAFAEDKAETEESTQLIAGNINDVESDSFSIELDGDSIKIMPNKVKHYTEERGWYEAGFYMDIASNDKASIKSGSAFYRSNADNLCFTPESNGKYIVVIYEFFSDYYTTFVSLDFCYVVPIICHDNIVDIDTDNIYALCDGETNSYIVKTTKRLYKWQSGIYPIAIVLPKDETVYSFKKFNDSLFEDNRALYLLLSCFFEDHFFLNGHGLILLGKDNTNKFYADFDSSKISQYDETYTRFFDSFKAAFEKNLSEALIYSINGMKPASRIFCAYPGYIKENTVFLQDSSGITKYHIDTVAVKNTDYDGEDDEYFRFLPETFTSIKIPEKDINLDGAVNLKDVAVLRRYIAGGWGIELNKVQKELADINTDNSIDLKDVVLLRRYIAGGWD